MNLNINEAIQLILDFYQFPHGFWKDVPIEDPLVNQFIEEGYVTLDIERQEKYELNDKGKDILHPYIEDISINFISYVKGNRFCSFNTEAIEWFANTYSLDNDTADSLYDYITFNLVKYGYKRFKFYKSECGWGYQFENV